MPNARIAELLTRCLRDRLVPSAWKATLLAAVPKAKGPYTDPENYRMIALECCMLKLMTLILEARIRGFVDATGAIPKTQNGFRSTYRTENNPFILRVAQETAHCESRPLYTAFVDLRNAFPSVDQSILWMKMLDKGISGPVFDWLRTLYTDMRYYLRREGGLSHPLQAQLGILMGDPASPLAFLLYVSDFRTSPHKDDVILAAAIIAHLEHADDMALFSMSPEGLQEKLDMLALWASRNQMQINTKKTVVVIFKPLRSQKELPQFTFTICDSALDVVKEQRYVGTLMSSQGPNIWDAHISACATSARRAANVSFFVESRTGQLPPWEGLILYRTQIDCRLTYGVEVTGVGTEKQLRQLEEVQHTYLRRLLGLQPRSQLCVLFTETGATPLLYRRLQLVLRYLKYLLLLPASHLARMALSQAIINSTTRRSGWWHDLTKHTDALGLHLDVEATAADIDVLLQELMTTMRERLRTEVQSSPKLQLLQQRSEYDSDGNSHTPAMAFRPYLRVHNKDARVSLTRLLVSDHRLEVETGRWRGIARQDRLCRACGLRVEDPVHVLFECTGLPGLISARERFWGTCEQLCKNPTSSLRRTAVLRGTVDDRSAFLKLQLLPPHTRIHCLLADSSTATSLAHFSHHSLLLFDALPSR